MNANELPTIPNATDRRQAAYETTVVGIVGVMREFGLDRTGESLTDTLRRALSGVHNETLSQENQKLRDEALRLRHIVRQLSQLI